MDQLLGTINDKIKKDEDNKKSDIYKNDEIYKLLIRNKIKNKEFLNILSNATKYWNGYVGHFHDENICHERCFLDTANLDMDILEEMKIKQVDGLMRCQLFAKVLNENVKNDYKFYFGCQGHDLKILKKNNF